MSKNQERTAKEKGIIYALLLITIIAVCVTVWAIFFREKETVLAPDYAPQEEEENSEAIPDDDTEKMEQPEGGGSVSLSYSKEVTVDLGDRTAKLYFANPGKSNQDIVLQLVIREEVIVQSGTIKPGKQVMNLNLLDHKEKMLEPGVYEGKFAVLYYHPETREKAVVNTEIPVTITVSE